MNGNRPQDYLPPLVSRSCCLGLPGLARAQEAALQALKIKLFKSGKADAFLIRTGNHAVLLDTAEVDDAEDIHREKAGFDDPHPFDKGHGGGAPDILRAVSVNGTMPDIRNQPPGAGAALAASQAEQMYLWRIWPSRWMA